MIDTQAIRTSNPLPSIVAAKVNLQRAGDEWKGCCPFHADRSPSFTIFSGGERFHCFGCGASGDVLDFVQRAYGVSLTEAARMLGAGQLPTVLMPKLPPADRSGRSSEAKTIWASAIPAAGTLGEAYLRCRGINPPFPPALRFSWLRCGKSEPMPCLICVFRSEGVSLIVVGCLHGITVALHRRP